MRIRTVLVAAVLAAVAVLPLAALAYAEPGAADRGCHDVASRAAAHEGIGCDEDRFAQGGGDGSAVSGSLFAAAPSQAVPLDATPPGLLGAGLGSMAATAAGYLVVRRTPARSHRRPR
jgi:hypothetical protein